MPGRPDCSYKGGAPGFVRVTADDELAFPSYDGNGMFRSLGNLLVNPAVGLLFIDFECPTACGSTARAASSTTIRCSRVPRRAADGAGAGGAHLPELPALHPSHALAETSPYAPRAGYTPPSRSGSASTRSPTCSRATTRRATRPADGYAAPPLEARRSTLGPSPPARYALRSMIFAKVARTSPSYFDLTLVEDVA